VAKKYGIGTCHDGLSEALGRPGVEAGSWRPPTPLHAEQAIACLKAGKHVQVEIPLADRWSDAQAVADLQKVTGLTCMVGHTRRFNPSHQWIHRKIAQGELSIQQMDVQTYFFRRTNINALGQPRSWTDHLLCITRPYGRPVRLPDRFARENRARGPGPGAPDAGNRHGQSIQLKSASGAICTLSLSFNNDGPLGTFFRYICRPRHVHRALRRPDRRSGAKDRCGRRWMYP